MINQNTLHKIGNIFGLVGICSILIIAFADQVIQHDLPCPLCLLQRACFIGIGVGLCMNLIKGIRIAHYGFMLLSSLLGLAISMRQIFLHIAPDDRGYGHVVLGFHLYIWAAIAFSIGIALLGVALLLQKGFIEKKTAPSQTYTLLIAFFLVLILANGISTFIECGVAICPANPVRYQLLN